jgi:hypothetical protein
VDKNVTRVRKKLADRAATGLKKYGVTTERRDLSLLDWLNHLQDELLDAAVYVERLKTDINTSKQTDNWREIL